MICYKHSSYTAKKDAKSSIFVVVTEYFSIQSFAEGRSLKNVITKSTHMNRINCLNSTKYLRYLK